MACEPNTLAEQARCFCFSFEQHLQIQTYLLCQIVLNGGGGGGGGSGAREVFSGSGDPTGVVIPEAGAPAAIYIDTDTGEIWQWYDGVWH